MQKLEPPPQDPHWVNSIKWSIRNIFEKEWKEDALTKSSLIDYLKIKDTPCLESYLLDQIDFYGASLKFKIRSNTLPLDGKISRWISDNDGTCRLCNNDVEDVKHFLFTCHSLNAIRIEEYCKLEKDLYDVNCIDIWQLFMSGNLDVKYHMSIGNVNHLCNSTIEAQMFNNIFDNFCKSFIKRAWKKRAEMIALM